MADSPELNQATGPAGYEAMMRKRYFVFLGAEHDRKWLEHGQHVGWTGHKYARRGDEVWFYITAPVSAIVAHGMKLGDYKHPSDSDPKWNRRLMNEVFVYHADLL